MDDDLAHATSLKATKRRAKKPHDIKRWRIIFSQNGTTEVVSRWYKYKPGACDYPAMLVSESLMEWVMSDRLVEVELVNRQRLFVRPLYDNVTEQPA